MGDDDEGHAELVLDVDQLELRVLAQLLVERAQWLVEQQHLRTLDQRARQRHALPLAAGKLVRLARGEFAELDDAEDLLDTGGDFRPGQALLLQAKATFFSTVMWGNSA